MKTTGKCPKCGGTDVYHNNGKFHYSDRSFIPTWLFGRAPVTTFICATCGYIEDYLGVTKAKHVKKLQKNWKRAVI